ncbi:MAG TPA: hypothetical protein VLT33_18410 [Labilithrix sp.]|nr:hypothetical protein [Labilithrix sp.]
MKDFRDLGDRIHAAWARCHFDEARFSGIAVEAIREADPRALFDHDEVLAEWLFGPGALEHSRNAEFGEPPITVYSSSRFMIEILHWLDGTPSIHQHGWSGAFCVLEGSSLHSTFAFEPAHRITSSLRVGELELERAELLRAGDCRAIRAGGELIHSVFHLDRPSISLVVRTYQERDQLPQWSYVKPYIAFDPYAPDFLRGRRLRKMLDLLAVTDSARYRALVERVAGEGDLGLVWPLLQQCHGQWEGVGRRPPGVDPGSLRAGLRTRFGDLTDRLFATCEEEMRTASLVRLRTEVTDPRLRVFLALLMNVSTRERIFELVAAYAGEDPRDTIRSWLRQLTVEGSRASVRLLSVRLMLDVLPVGTTAAELILRAIDAMTSGLRGDDLVREMLSVFETAGLGDARGRILDLEQLLASSVLRPLFTSLPAGVATPDLADVRGDRVGAALQNSQQAE